MPRAEMPDRVEQFPARVCECGAVHDRPEAGCPECGSVIARAAGEAIFVADVPKLYAHWLEQLKEELLGDDAVAAAVTRLDLLMKSEHFKFVLLDSSMREAIEAAFAAIPIEGEER